MKSSDHIDPGETELVRLVGEIENLVLQILIDGEEEKQHQSKGESKGDRNEELKLNMKEEQEEKYLILSQFMRQISIEDLLKKERNRANHAVGGILSVNSQIRDQISQIE